MHLEHPRMRAAGSLIVAAILLPGCVREESSMTHSTVTDSAGITIVTNASPQWAYAEGWTVMREPELRVGVLEGDEAYEFHDVAAAALQSDGDLVVADARTGTVRLYDSAGVFKRVLGSAGSGPGEFRRPGPIVIGAADSVFVWDGVSWRLTKFGAGGEYADTETFSPARISELAMPPLYPDSVIPLHDGTYLVRLGDKGDNVVSKSGKFGAGQVNGAGGSGSYRRRAGALRASIDSSTTQVLAQFPGTEQVWVESPWGPLAVAPALARTASISVQPGKPRVCIGDQETTEVRCFEGNGSVTIIRWQAAPIAVNTDGALIAEWRESTLESFGQKLSPDVARQLVEQVPVPAFFPAYSGLLLDRTGHVWVERGSSERADASEFFVFTPAGLLLGVVEVPNVRVMEIGDDYLLGVREDELGVQYLELYRLEKP